VRRHRAHAFQDVELRVRDRTDHLVDQQLVVSSQRRERRSQLVAHRGEKAALRAIGTLRSQQEQRLVHGERRMVGEDAQLVHLAFVEGGRTDAA
jgi:hypothetical protein